MSNELERAGRAVADSPIADAAPVDVLQRRVRRRRAVRIGAALTTTCVVAVATLAMAAAMVSDSDQPKVLVTPPSTAAPSNEVECPANATPWQIKVGGMGRSGWSVPDKGGHGYFATESFNSDGTRNVTVDASGGYPKAGPDAERREAEVRACVDRPPVLPVSEWPVRGVLLERLGATLVIANGQVLGRAEPSPFAVESIEGSTVRVDSSRAEGEFEFAVPTSIESVGPAADVSFPVGTKWWINAEEGSGTLSQKPGTCDDPARATLTNEAFPQGKELLPNRRTKTSQSYVVGWLGAKAVVAFVDECGGQGEIDLITTTATGLTRDKITGLYKDIPARYTVFERVDTPPASTSSTTSTTTAVTPPPTTPGTTQPITGVTVPESEGVDMTLAEARALWAATNATTYSFRYAFSCGECGQWAQEPLRVTVRDGVPTAVWADPAHFPGRPEFPEPYQYENLTFEHFFDTVEGLQSESTEYTSRVKYDPTIGVPIESSYSCVDTEIQDCGSGTYISNIVLGA